MDLIREQSARPSASKGQSEDRKRCPGAVAGPARVPGSALEGPLGAGGVPSDFEVSQAALNFGTVYKASTIIEAIDHLLSVQGLVRESPVVSPNPAAHATAVWPVDPP